MRNLPHSTRLILAFAAVILASAGCSDPTKGKPEAVVAEPAAQPGASMGTPVPAKAEAGAATYVFSAASTLGFVGSKVTGSHEGGFADFTGSVRVPNGGLAQAQIRAVIQIGSIYTDNDRLTGHLKSADFFDAAQFPESNVSSTAIEKDGDQYEVTADLSLHGVTKSITFPAQITLSDSKLAADAEFSINRFDFGIVYPGKTDDLIRENVLIKLHIEAGV